MVLPGFPSSRYQTQFWTNSRIVVKLNNRSKFELEIFDGEWIGTEIRGIREEGIYDQIVLLESDSVNVSHPF